MGLSRRRVMDLNTSVLVLFGLLLGQLLFGQTPIDSTALPFNAIVKMENGKKYEGQMLEYGTDTLILRTENGDISLITSKIRTIKPNEYVGPDSDAYPNNARYFIGPSAMPIKKGDGYYQNILVTSSNVNYGLTKNISVGGGLEFISMLYGEPLWTVSAKAGFPITENVHAGVGVLAAGISNFDALALPYTIFTFGNTKSNFSIAAAYGIVGGELTNGSTIMASGKLGLNNRIALITENFIVPVYESYTAYLGIHGIRIEFRANSFDIGGIIFSDIIDYVPILPLVGYVRTFG